MWAWSALYPNTGRALQPLGFPESEGKCYCSESLGEHGWDGSVGIAEGVVDAQGVGAPGWEFCFPLLCFHLRPVEIRDQQGKSNCSSSQALWPFSQAVFSVGRIPLPIVQDAQWDLSVCRGMNSSLLSAPKGEGFGGEGVKKLLLGDTWTAAVGRDGIL